MALIFNHIMNWEKEYNYQSKYTCPTMQEIAKIPQRTAFFPEGKERETIALTLRFATL